MTAMHNLYFNFSFIVAIIAIVFLGCNNRVTPDKAEQKMDATAQQGQTEGMYQLLPKGSVVKSAVAYIDQPFDKTSGEVPEFTLNSGSAEQLLLLLNRRLVPENNPMKWESAGKIIVLLESDEKVLVSLLATGVDEMPIRVRYPNREVKYFRCEADRKLIEETVRELYDKSKADAEEKPKDALIGKE